MRIGLQIPRYTWPGGTPAIRSKFADAVRGAERSGARSLWVMDHYFQIRGVGPAEEEMLEAYTVLGYAAALTERISLGTMVTGVTYRHPGLLVKTATTLDVLAGGRTYFGIGAAWNDEESAGLGVPFPPVGERFERLEEALRITLQMWKGDESPFKGRYYTLERPLNSPQPLTDPHPPILIGGVGERKTLRLVAKYADACNIFDGGDEFVTQKLKVLRDHCTDLGRNYDEIEKTSLSSIRPGDSVAKVVDRAGKLGELGIEHALFNSRDAAGDHTQNIIAELVRQVG